MWLNWGLNYVTVLPAIGAGVAVNQHYNDLFEKSGADIYFVTEDDPNIEEKLKRGLQGVVENIIPTYRPPSSSERVQHLLQTTPRVQRLHDDTLEVMEGNLFEHPQSVLVSERAEASLVTDRFEYEFSHPEWIVGFDESLFDV